MTQPALFMMSVSVGAVLLLFLFCLARVLTAPQPDETDG
jgi:ABC-type Fe3+-siderophore transport system permease subunit